MDKVSVALAATEDNAAAIRELSKQLARKTACRIIQSQLNDDGVSSFGNVTSDGSVGVIIKFAGSTITLEFCDQIVVSGTSPMFAVLPAGSGELKFNMVRAASALLIGGA